MITITYPANEENEKKIHTNINFKQKKKKNSKSDQISTVRNMSNICDISRTSRKFILTMLDFKFLMTNIPRHNSTL